MDMEGDWWENNILSPFVQQKSDRTTIILNKLKLISERTCQQIHWELLHPHASVGVCADKSNWSIVLCLQNKHKACSDKLILQWIILATFVVSLGLGVGKKFEVLSDLPVYYMLWVFSNMWKPTILKFQGFCGLVIQQCLGNVLGRKLQKKRRKELQGYCWSFGHFQQ